MIRAKIFAIYAVVGVFVAVAITGILGALGIIDMPQAVMISAVVTPCLGTITTAFNAKHLFEDSETVAELKNFQADEIRSLKTQHADSVAKIHEEARNNETRLHADCAAEKARLAADHAKAIADLDAKHRKTVEKNAEVMARLQKFWDEKHPVERPLGGDRPGTTA